MHPDVAFLYSDLHAHLCDAEIIGLLGGRWDPETREMHVQAPLPCRAVPRDDRRRYRCGDGSGLGIAGARSHPGGRDPDVVGWYHSHPRFMVGASVSADIENQRQYQTLLFEDDARGTARRPL